MKKQTLLKSIQQALVVMSITAMGLMAFNFAPVNAQGLINPEDNPQKISVATGGQTNARQLVLTILNFFLGFLGLLAVIMIIYGGFLYVSAAGDQGKIDNGKKIIMYSIVGIIIILLSFAIVNTVLSGIGTGSDTGA